jgi:hypothetical protein
MGDKESFQKGKSVRKGPPKRKLRANIVKMLSEHKESQNDGFEGYSKKHNWTHKSYLWELSYTKALILPNNIDLMHQKHNVVKSIISMYFDVTDFSKVNVAGAQKKCKGKSEKTTGSIFFETSRKKRDT